ncbi:MAG: ABC-type transport auxiliary lipoprotein family protein [Pseudomonadota bacterium]
MNKAFAAVSGLALAIAGCGPLVDLGGENGPPARIFDLGTATGDSTRLQLIKQVIVYVEEPVANAVLDTDRMVIRMDGGEVKYLPGARWSTRPTRMIRLALQQTLGQVDRLTAVGRGALDIPSDYRLKVNLQGFEVDGTGAAALSYVAITVYLIDSSGKLIASESFRDRSMLSIADPALVAENLNTSLTRVATALAQWLTTNIDSAS